MKFIFDIARRELRAAWQRLLFFFLCIAIGVASIVSLRSMIQNINLAVAGEARVLLTADVQVDTGRPWPQDALNIIDRTAQPPLVTGRTETIEAATMIRPADQNKKGTSMIELKGIDPPFPLVGEFKLSNGERFDYQLLKNQGAVVSKALMERLNLQINDQVKIGELSFQIRATFDQEPGDGGNFRLGPRVFIERSSVEATGLTGFGSRARRKIFLTTPEGQAEPLIAKLKHDLRNSLVNIKSYKESQENLAKSLQRAEDYLSLTGLVVLVLGGIGISNVTMVFIEQRKKSIAVLKCLGANGNKITLAYLLQIITLGLFGSLLGLALAKVTLMLVAYQFAESLPNNMSYALRFNATLQGLGVGLLISILFSILPLLAIRKIKPNLLLRDTGNKKERRIDLLNIFVGITVSASLLAIVAWQAGSIKVGFYFLTGLIVTAIILHLTAMLLVGILRRLRPSSSFTIKQAINSLYRPGNQTRVIVMVVGLGVFLILSIQSLQSNLINDLDLGRNGKLPSMFLIDIQSDQVEGVAQLIQQASGQAAKLIPTVRAKIFAINDKEIDLESAMRRDRGMLGREYVVTYRNNLEENEQIIEGKFWPDTASTQPEVSIEEGMKGVAGLGIGSKITFDVQGRKITALVSNIRRVDWRNSRTGFMVLFRPGALDRAPHMYVGTIDGMVEQTTRQRFQRELLDRFPNISIIDVTEIIARVKKIVNNVSLAVSFIGGFVFLSGALILIGSIVMTKFHRIYETAILKTLGAQRRTLLAILLAEFGLLGSISALIGAGAAAALSFAISKYIFEIPWQFTLSINLLGVLITIFLMMVVGALSTYDVLSRKPLATLRAP